MNALASPTGNPLRSALIALTCTLNVIALTSPACAQFAPPDIAHHWSFDGTANDSTGGANGVLGGTTSFPSSGPVAGTHSLDLASIGARCDIDAALPSLMTNHWALSLWFNPRSVGPSSWPRLLATQRVSNSGLGIAIPYGSQINCSVGGTNVQGVAYPTLVVSTPPSNWQHLVLSNDGGSLSIYSNGVLSLPSPASVGTPAPTTSHLSLGNIPLSDLPYDRAFDGRLDEVTIFTRPISATEVAALYSTPSLVSTTLNRPYPGSNEDLAILTGLGGATPDPLAIKTTVAGNSLTVNLLSPGGTFVGSPLFLAAQAFPTGGPKPVGPAPYASILHLNFGAVLLVGPTSLSTPVLATGGNSYPMQIPPFISGVSLMLQGFAVTPTAANGVLAATDGHLLRVL